MSHAIDFLVSPTELQVAYPTWWEMRNTSMSKVMQEVRRLLLEEGTLKSEWRIRVHMHDWTTPTEPPTPGLIEVQTVSEMSKDEELFPDWGFGGWSHIGMHDWWPFVTELAAEGSKPPENPRAFWKGNHLGVELRGRYMEVRNSHPERFEGEFMTWSWDGVPDNFTPMKEQCRHAVLVDLTGTGFSGRLKMLGFTNRPIIIAWRRWWCWASQEIYRQGLHFDCREDLSDMVEVYDKIAGDMRGARERAWKMRDFCLKNLTFDAACKRGARLIREAMERNPRGPD